MSNAQTPASDRTSAMRSHMIPATDRLSRLPYWLLAALLIAILSFWIILSNENYQVIFAAVIKGVWTTIYVSIVAYSLALILGLGWCMLRVSKVRWMEEISSFFVEVLRGIPMLVLLYFISFAAAPAVVSALNWLGGPLIETGTIEAFSPRQFDFTARAVLALSIGYSAFISEILRAGIESIEKEQKEAAQTEGAGYWQIMRFILLPQAIRNVLPALGNEFIAMLKDSALVSVLGVQDITQLGKVYSASTFKFFQTYSIVALLYLVMTLGLAMLIRWVEQRLELD